jgi:predicted acylesterase/phospholipase RssA
MANQVKFDVAGLKNPDGDMLLQEMDRVGEVRDEVRKLAATVRAGNEEGPYAIGLALSGGGIRSATVSLGILQKLAATGFLKHVDYLSTVSGGGYTGSALTWWLRGTHHSPTPFNTDANFPFGTVDPADPENSETPAPPLQYLRTQGQYLTPSKDISIWSGISIFLRAIFLNLLVWIPVTALIMLVLYGIGRLPFMQGLPWMVRMLAPEALTGLADTVGSRGAVELNQTVPAFFLFLLLLSILAFGIFLIGCLGHSLLSWNSKPPASDNNGKAPANKTNPKTLQWYHWPVTGLVLLLGLAFAVTTILWVNPIIEPMFAGGREIDRSLLPSAMTASRMKLGFALLSGLALAVFYLLWRTTRLNSLRWFGPNDITGMLAVLGGLAACLVFAYIHGGSHGDSLLSYWLQFIFAVASIVFGYYLVSTLIRYFLRYGQFGERKSFASTQPLTVEYLHYGSRRQHERNFGKILSWGVMLAIIGSLPLVHSYIGYKIGGTGAALGLIFAAGGNIWGRIAGHGRLTSLFIVIGSALICYGVLLIGYSFALDAMAEGAEAMPRAVLAGSIIVALLTGWFANTNHIGLHRFYRDRLMEAFLPDYEDEWRDHVNDFKPSQPASERPPYENAPSRGANDFRIVDAWPSPEKAEAKEDSGPYHIVNTNLVLSNSLQRHYRLRGGDNFILSPLHFGSSATGWRSPKETDFHDLSLASAMAISGAAANPRGGAGGRGLTRNSFVSLVMNLLNVRLGYWVPNPNHRIWKFMPKRPNHFWPGGIYALGNAFGYGYREDSYWVELADGGHFENLAVYELVRRRCGLIIVCDGGQDNASSYADLVTAIQRVGEDFGARIHLDVEINSGKGSKFQWQKSSPAQIIAKASNGDFPKGAEFAERGYFVARIDYGKERGSKGWPKQGVLVYLKSSLIKTLDARAKGYAGANAEFPNQTTADQFFDPEQFEAYREVGYRICEQMLEELELAWLFRDGRPSLKELRRNHRFRF